MKLLEGRIHGYLIPTPKDKLGSRSILLGYPVHLTHHFLNHPYPPKAFKRRLISMVEGESQVMLLHCHSVLDQKGEHRRRKFGAIGDNILAL